MNIEEAKQKLKQSLNSDIYNCYREWPYKNVPRRIIAEQFIECPGKIDLTDYKIFCFNGEPKYIQVIQDRHTKETIDFFDTNWNHMDFIGLNKNARNAKVVPTKPKKLDIMLNIARQLAKDTIFIRVDLYSIDIKIFFGELTFYPASGLGTIYPNEWSLKLGDLIKI